MAGARDLRVDDSIAALPDWLAPDPEGIITAGHDDVTGRQISITDAEAINGPALVAILRSIVADNRAGGWRRLKQARGA